MRSFRTCAGGATYNVDVQHLRCARATARTCLTSLLPYVSCTTVVRATMSFIWIFEKEINLWGLMTLLTTIWNNSIIYIYALLTVVVKIHCRRECSCEIQLSDTGYLIQLIFLDEIKNFNEICTNIIKYQLVIIAIKYLYLVCI